MGWFEGAGGQWIAFEKATGLVRGQLVSALEQTPQQSKATEKRASGSPKLQQRVTGNPSSRGAGVVARVSQKSCDAAKQGQQLGQQSSSQFLQPSAGEHSAPNHIAQGRKRSADVDAGGMAGGAAGKRVKLGSSHDVPRPLFRKRPTNHHQPRTIQQRPSLTVDAQDMIVGLDGAGFKTSLNRDQLQQHHQIQSAEVPQAKDIEKRAPIVVDVDSTNVGVPRKRSKVGRSEDRLQPSSATQPADNPQANAVESGVPNVVQRQHEAPSTLVRKRCVDDEWVAVGAAEKRIKLGRSQDQLMQSSQTRVAGDLRREAVQNSALNVVRRQQGPLTALYPQQSVDDDCVIVGDAERTVNLEPGYDQLQQSSRTQSAEKPHANVVAKRAPDVIEEQQETLRQQEPLSQALYAPVPVLGNICWNTIQDQDVEQEPTTSFGATEPRDPASELGLSKKNVGSPSSKPTTEVAASGLQSSARGSQDSGKPHPAALRVRPANSPLAASYDNISVVDYACPLPPKKRKANRDHDGQCPSSPKKPKVDVECEPQASQPPPAADDTGIRTHRQGANPPKKVKPTKTTGKGNSTGSARVTKGVKARPYAPQPAPAATDDIGASVESLDDFAASWYEEMGLPPGYFGPSDPNDHKFTWTPGVSTYDEIWENAEKSWAE